MTQAFDGSGNYGRDFLDSGFESVAAVTRNGHGLSEESPLSTSEATMERLVMGLRLTEGVSLRDIPEGALDMTKVANPNFDRYLFHSSDRLAVTDAGMPVLEALLREIVRA